MGFIAGWVETTIDYQNNAPLCQDIIEKITKKHRGQYSKKMDSFVVCAAPHGQLIETDGWLCAVSDADHGQRSQLREKISRYQDMGESCLPTIMGKGALALADLNNRRLILATDPIGQTNLYYAETKSGLVFGSSADSVIEHPEVNAEISPQTIYDYVYFHHCPSPNTIYKQVKKLEGGQVLVYQNGKIQISHYWLPEFSEQAISVEEAGQQLMQMIDDSVKDLSSSAEETGAFLSGGLDSSTVAGALANAFPGGAKTFSIGFPVEGYDEIDYARIAVDHFKTKAHEYYVTPDDTVAAIPKIAAYYDEPFGNSSALAAYYCAKMAKENGIKVLLGGDGGDEIFAGNERYAKQLLFQKYYQIPGLARQVLKTGLYHAPDIFLKNKIIFKAKRYVEQAEVPLPDRLQDYNYLNRHPAEEIFAEDFLQEINAESPLQTLRDCYNRPMQASALNRMLYMDWKTTLHDNDLVKVNRMCEMVGVDVQYPLLSQAIVELSCRIPSNDKLKGQQLRWFYKRAMRDFLPKPIINKSKHGFGLPFGIWLKDHQPLKELAYDSINSLAKRGYFRKEFFDHAINMHQSIHAAYYGELIWILMMLELWLQGKDK
nr:asparagine synthase C-terminal domain-containing protein [Methylomarinum sp. Ch1-1]MDP4521219.1 asparagine synthase C-terminal domain-containing protein [Methylomarinum sp. Ch1-1]